MAQASENFGIANATYTMNGGVGPNSYSQNSDLQRVGIEAAMDLLTKTIPGKINIASLSRKTTFRIADLGCSTGPNTFMAMKNIIEVVNLQYKSISQNSPEFHVFFNDKSNNDFNTLFKNIPLSLSCFVAGVPGSFHDRLFPRASLDIVYSSYSLHWLSKVPVQVNQETAQELNKKKMYSDQFHWDMKRFIESRAEEVVGGGLMVILLPVKTSDDNEGGSFLIKLLREALLDMAKMGVIKEDEVESFNTPSHIPSINEVKYVIEATNFFNIEEIITWSTPYSSIFNAKSISAQLRAGGEQVLQEHYGSEIIDQLFEILIEKVENNKQVFENESLKRGCSTFLLLKRKD